MAILAQSLFPLVGCDLMPLTLTTTWHIKLSYWVNMIKNAAILKCSLRLTHPGTDGFLPPLPASDSLPASTHGHHRCPLLYTPHSLIIDVLYPFWTDKVHETRFLTPA